MQLKLVPEALMLTIKQKTQQQKNDIPAVEQWIETDSRYYCIYQDEQQQRLFSRQYIFW